MVLAQAIFTVNLYFAIHHEWMSEIQPCNQYLIDKNLRTFSNFVSDIDLVGIIGFRLRGVFKLYLGKSQIVVSVQNY